MHLQSHAQNTRKTARRPRLAVLLVAILASLTLLVAQAMPLAASGNQGASGGWIEICGDGGSFFIQLDDENPQPPVPVSGCNHCPFCLVPFNTSLGLDAPNTFPVMEMYFARIRFPAPAPGFVNAANTHWPACRGPPLLKMDNNMKTKNHSLSAQEQTSLTFDTWGVPCL
jgi:hypothetical protein